MPKATYIAHYTIMRNHNDAYNFTKTYRNMTDDRVAHLTTRYCEFSRAKLNKIEKI